MQRLFIILSFFIVSLSANTQSITIDDIYKNHKFYGDYVSGFDFMNNGKDYLIIEKGKINVYDIQSGDLQYTLFVGSEHTSDSYSGKVGAYTLDKNEKNVLIQTDIESIYRRSKKARYFIYSREKDALTPLREEKVSYATYNPQSDKIAYVMDNNIYYYDLSTEEHIQVTTDGTYNKIINGAADWVYEEEFSITKSFFWSPDGDKIGYIRYDESDVKSFSMKYYNDNLYPDEVTFKYPKVGEVNAVVSVHIYDLKNKTTKEAPINTNKEDIYVPRLKWINDSELCIFHMNRHQNDLSLLAYDTEKGTIRTFLHETNPYYVDIHDDLQFINKGREFIWTSEKDGYNHIYIHKTDGSGSRQITKGSNEVINLYGYDEKKKTLYFQAYDGSPMDKNIYSVSDKGRRLKKLSKKTGNTSAQFSSTYDFYVLRNSSINRPQEVGVYSRRGKMIRSLVENKKLKAQQKEHKVQPVEFFSFETSEGVKLNGYQVKPVDFDPSKKYPVFMTQYSGPGSQQVTDSWKGATYWWHQHLAQSGYMVVCVDPRGTGGRGQEFKKMTYLNLGKYETIDQIEAAKYLASLPYVDGSRIGIYGWSYGGYMSSLCILKGNDVFKAAIAVAPVTSWKWYDTIYTERYMRTLKENKEGYEENSPIYFADRLKGSYLLIHGMADDNVHFQHTTEMAAALIKANKQFDTYFYPNRNHGIYGNNARVHLFTKMTNFIKERI